MTKHAHETMGPAKRRIKLEDGSYVSFFWIESAVVEHLYKASPAAWVVYLVICKYARNTTQESYPSIQTMADLIGCSPNTVRKGVRELEQSKLIAVRQTGKPGREHNVYRLLPAAKIRRSTPSGIEGAGSKFEGAPSKSAHELEEVELDVLNQKESRTTQGSDSQKTLIGRDSLVSLSKTNGDEPIPEESYHRLWLYLIESGMVGWREVERDAAALRRLWNETTGCAEEREERVREAIDQGLCRRGHDDPDGVFSTALWYLQHEELSA